VNPLVLSVDTTHEFGSLALLRGEEVVEELLLHAPAGFSQVLYTYLRHLLDRHAVDLHSVDCFAAASGPGSFTGVRVGLAAVKGLAEACGKPVVAVGNLRAMAAFGTMPLRAVLLDARRGEIYGAVYDARGNPVTPEVVAPFPAWIAALPETDIEFLATDFGPFASAIESSRGAGALLTTVPRALAAAIARIALDRWRAGAACDPAAIDANYVRRSDAELLWKDR
jgi:tRNA threonylcarbamoyladenosine biosynthesis protein TsaB